MLVVLSFAALLFIDPSVVADMENSYKGLKEAQNNKDAALVKKLAGETSALARKVAADPAPQGEVEKEDWKNRVAYARDIEVQSEYALFVTAAAAPAATAVDLFETLEKQNPKSRYLDEGYSRYLYALNQNGAASRIPAVAEKGLANLPDQEDLLLVMAENSQAKKQSDRALAYARRLIVVLNKHPKPEGMAAADWDKKKATSLSHGYWIAGVICGEKGLFAESDRNLRAALPLIKGQDALMGPALFYLGVSNYQLGKQTLNKARVVEAQKFSEEGAKIQGPYQNLAWKNAMSIKDEAGRMR